MSTSVTSISRAGANPSAATATPTTYDHGVPSAPATAPGPPAQQGAPIVVLHASERATRPASRHVHVASVGVLPPAFAQTAMNAIGYQFPKDGWQTILLLAFFLYVDQADVGTLGARIRNAVGGPRTLDVLRKLTVLVHIGEALAMLVVNIKRQSSPLVTVRM